MVSVMQKLFLNQNWFGIFTRVFTILQKLGLLGEEWTSLTCANVSHTCFFRKTRTTLEKYRLELPPGPQDAGKAIVTTRMTNCIGIGDPDSEIQASLVEIQGYGTPKAT